MDEPVDAARPGVAQQLDLLPGQLILSEHAGADRVVDVVVDVGDPVDDANDLPLCAWACVVENPVANLLGQVQSSPIALEDVDDAQGVLVVREATAEVTAELVVERVLARMAEGRVPEVVAEADRLDEILVQPERTGDAA